MILVETAVEFFTNQIRFNSKDPFLLLMRGMLPLR